MFREGDWPPPPWMGAETNPVKIFFALRQPNWDVIKCPFCGKVAIAPSNLRPIHVSKDHIAVYEAVATRLTWKQAREMAGDSDVFGIFTKEGTPEAWEKAVQMLDDLACVEMEERK